MNDEDLFGVQDLDNDEVIVDITGGENVEQDATVAEKEDLDNDEVIVDITGGENVEQDATVAEKESKVECYNCHKMGHFSKECRQPRNQDSSSSNQDDSRRTVNVEETPPKAMIAIDGVGFDWSYMAEDENEVIFYEKIPVLKRDMSYRDSEISGLKCELEKLKNEKESTKLKLENFDQASKSLDKLIGSQITDKSRKESKNASETIPNELKESTKVKESSDVPLVKNRVSDNKDYIVESPIVVEKKIVVPTVAKIEFVKSKQQEKLVRKPIKYTEMYRSQAQSTVKRPYQQRTAFTNKSFRQTVNTASLRPVNTVRPRPVNIARPNSTIVNTVRENKDHPQQVKDDQGYVDSGCSRHMIGNMSYLSDFKEFNGGYVTFGGGANSGRVT
nr:putative ribonuclease H-like domain-containing protein [Tanacetum cinerariifolium]